MTIVADPWTAGITAAASLLGGGGDGVAATPEQNIFQPDSNIQGGDFIINPQPGLPLINDIDLSDPQQAIFAAGGVIIVGMVALAVVRRLGR